MTARIIEAVRSIAAADTLLVALDFDGTVSHLDDDPMAVRAVPAASAVVAALSRLDDTYVAYVSGRSLRDLEIISERPPVSPIILVGSHGAEYMLPAALSGPDDGADADDDGEGDVDGDAVLERARDAVADLEAVRIEPKRFGFAVHTRVADADATAESTRRIDRLMGEIAPGWRRRSGHDVVEFSWRPEGKDVAVERLRDIVGATNVIFAGDDVTDEDALAALRPADLGVRVGTGETAAAIRVGDPEELAKLLDVVASIRARRGQ